MGYRRSKKNCNCGYILFTKLPWPGDSEGTFWSLSQAAICPPVYHTRWNLHTVPLVAEHQAGKLWIPIWFDPMQVGWKQADVTAGANFYLVYSGFWFNCLRRFRCSYFSVILGSLRYVPWCAAVSSTLVRDGSTCTKATGKFIAFRSWRSTWRWWSFACRYFAGAVLINVFPSTVMSPLVSCWMNGVQWYSLG